MRSDRERPLHPVFPDRRAAGRVLGARVAEALRDPRRGATDAAGPPLVLGLPRGGVPVAMEVADALDAPLDLMVVRKLGVPGHEELAMGAIASGGVRVLNRDVVDGLDLSAATIDEVARREEAELRRRERAYRGDRPLARLAGRRVVLVDDGLATGATMRAAAAAARQLGPARVIVAVPVAPVETIDALEREVDLVVCPATPAPFFGVGQWYVDFSQTTDDEVRALLAQAWRQRAGREAP